MPTLQPNGGAGVRDFSHTFGSCKCLCNSPLKTAFTLEEPQIHGETSLVHCHNAAFEEQSVKKNNRPKTHISTLFWPL